VRRLDGIRAGGTRCRTGRLARASTARTRPSPALLPSRRCSLGSCPTRRGTATAARRFRTPSCDDTGPPGVRNVRHTSSGQCMRSKPFVCTPRSTAVRRSHYEKVRDLLSSEAFEARLDSVIEEWGGLLDRDTAAMVVVERLGRSVASFARVADLEEGMEANLRATVVAISPVRTFTRQDGTEGRVTN